MAACRQINHASAINTLTTLSTYCYKFASLVAGWSSLVARRAHNPKAAGSNPAPATKDYAHLGDFLSGLFSCLLQIVKQR